jgi:hypothetical protein
VLLYFQEMLDLGVRDLTSGIKPTKTGKNPGTETKNGFLAAIIFFPFVLFDEQ